MALRQHHLIAFGVAWLVLTGAAPSRTCTYTAGQIIQPDCVGENEDNIFSYLQGGVDTYDASSVTSTAILDGTITSADIGSAAITSANITDSTIVTADISDGTIVNADISSSAAIDYSKLGTLTSGNLLVGNSSNVATSTNPSGDVDISNTGVFTVQSNSVALGTDTTGNYAGSSSEGGAATTATALAANGSNCSAGSYPLGVDASGASESCTAVPVVVADRVVRTAGDVTTTSTSLVDLTSMSITLTTSANPAIVGFAADCQNDGTNANSFNVDIDGADELGTEGIRIGESAAGRDTNCSFTVLTSDLTAASHTFKIQWRVSGGTGTVVCNSANPCTMFVAEVTD